jgi:hypothetical protein
MGTNVRQNIVTNGLVLYLDAGSRMSYPGSGATWTDLSGNNSSGSLINGPTYSTTYGGALTFNGSNNNVDLGNSTITQFPNNSSWSFFYTLELLSQNTTYASILSKGNSTSTGILVYYANYGSAGSVLMKQNNSEPTSVVAGLNKPFQYAAVYNGSGAVKIYLNGTYINNGPVIASFDSSNALKLATGDAASNIRIYSFMKYNRALPEQEIAQNYNATKTRFGLS